MSSRRSVLGAVIAVGLGLLGPAPALSTQLPASARDRSLTRLERQEAQRLLAVVSKKHPIEPPGYVPSDLVRWKNTDYQVRAEVAEQLDAMFRRAQASGLRLRVISGFRSYDTQRQTHQYWAARYGRAAADRSSARAGHSEHQTGLAVDLDVRGQGQTCYLDACFGSTPEGRWVAANAYRFGFLQSYPQGYRHRTGYIYEPWHLRYVGPRVAGTMRRRGVVLLEDYLREVDRPNGPTLPLGAPTPR